MMLVYYVLCALFVAVCVLIAIAATRNCVQRVEELRRMLSALSSERSMIEAHATAIDQLRDDFRSLRGKFYAERRKSPESQFDSPQESTADLKSRLRKQLGLIPGRN